jgi:hypothetical protein
VAGRQPNTAEHPLLAETGKRPRFRHSASVREQCEFSGISHRYISYRTFSKTRTSQTLERPSLRPSGSAPTRSCAAPSCRHGSLA